METLSPRMFRACLELLQYRINFKWVPGWRMSVCDALGRRPVYQSWCNLPDPLKSLQEDAPLQHSIYNIMGLDPFLGVEVSDSIKEAIRVDANYQEILKAVGTITRKIFLTYQQDILPRNWLASGALSPRPRLEWRRLRWRSFWWTQASYLFQ